MADQRGRFVWYELMASDTEAAKAFYTKVVGWGTQDGPVPGMAYTMFTTGQMPVGGMMAQPEDARKMGAPPSWIGYVAVDDVDATAERIKRLGGAVHVPPTDIPNVGRFSVVADPQSAVFALFNSPNTCDAPLPEPGTPGHVGWHELSAADWQKAFAFYSELFGWQKAEAMDMGAMGTYQIFSVGGQPVGGKKAISVKKGDTIRLKVTSDETGEIHVHGFDLEEEAAPGKPASFTFTADIEGRFEVESHVGDVQIAQISVNP